MRVIAFCEFWVILMNSRTWGWFRKLAAFEASLGDCTLKLWSLSNWVVQFSHSVMSNSLQPHGLQRARVPCPSPTLGACSNSCVLSRWCHPTTLSSVIPFSSCLQFFPASGSFPISHLHIRWPKYCSFSFSISPANEYSELISFRIDWFDLLEVQKTLTVLLYNSSTL